MLGSVRLTFYANRQRSELVDHAEHDFGRFGLRFDAGLFDLDLRVAGGRVDERALGERVFVADAGDDVVAFGGARLHVFVVVPAELNLQRAADERSRATDDEAVALVEGGLLVVGGLVRVFILAAIEVLDGNHRLDHAKVIIGEGGHDGLVVVVGLALQFGAAPVRLAVDEAGVESLKVVERPHETLLGVGLLN